MVGGKIIEICREDGKIRLWCVGTGCEQYDELAVYVRAIPPEAAAGDSLWWQGKNAYWTPKDHNNDPRKIDVALERISYSFDPRKHKGLAQ
jgi:hypothetical protein